MIHAVECNIIKTNLIILNHPSGNDIALSDKVCYETVRRLIVDLLWGSDLKDLTFLHNDDLIRHRKCFFLIMRYEDKCNTDLLLDTLQLILHFLTKL